MSVYCVSDLHGCFGLWKQIKAFVKPEDTIYVLGDCGDRGKNSWETIKAVLTDSQAIYLKGNHEDMLIQAANEWFKDERCGSAFQLLASNGGKATFYDMTCDEWGKEWVRCLKELPIRAIYTNSHNQTIYLTHAGFTPQLNADGELKWNWNDDLLWGRDHFFDEWDEKTFPNSYVVHGHTSVIHLDSDLKTKIYKTEEDIHNPKALFYCNGHKIDIDMLSAYTGVAALLNLDTFEVQYFRA